MSANASSVYIRRRTDGVQAAVLSLLGGFLWTLACGGSENFAGGAVGSAGASGASGLAGVGNQDSVGGASFGSGSDTNATTGAGGASSGGAASASGTTAIGSAGGAGSGGSTASGGRGASGSSASAAGGAAGGGGNATAIAQFSFFVTSLRALQQLSGSQDGFGGDLRYGETGDGAGLRGADKICGAIAEMSMPGSSAKQWRAFLSASTDGSGGGPVNAIDRVGTGPWYDRLGRVVALTKDDLQQTRPRNADPAIADDLPNEDGVPNHAPDPTQGEVDNHDTLTGSTETGLYYGSTRATCNDWTSAVGSDGTPRVGHSWPRTGGPGGGGFPGGGGGRTGGMGMGNMASWTSALDEAGCAPGVNLVETGPPNSSNPTVGSGGGYGGFYCFALAP